MEQVVFAFAGMEEGMTVSALIRKMIAYSKGNLHDIAHFLKVYAYAKTIGECEHLDEDTQLTLEVAAALIERVTYLVGHHHTLTGIEGMDYQILIEADYLVNADESNYDEENIRNMYEKVFRTDSGKALLRDIYSLEEREKTVLTEKR